MIEGLKPYTAYQPVASNWIPGVPAHWSVRKLRTLIASRNERNRPDLPLLSVARERGVFVRSADDENHNVIPHDLSNYKVARAGGLVINKMKAWQGSMGIAPCDGIVSPAYFVYDLRIENRAFGQALLRSRPYVAHFAQASDGVRIGQWDLSINGMREVPIVLPPADEQAAIVRFLNHANRRIDQFIRAKKKLIALLNEQKQGIIHRAVTRGLDPNVPMRDSGVPWLGEIPRHWDIRPLKHLIAQMDYGTSESGRGDGPVRVLTMAHIKDGLVTIPSVGSLPSVPPGLALAKNDLLFNRTNSADLVGKVGMFEGDSTDEITFASYLVRLRIREPNHAEWLNFTLNSTRFWAFARSHALVSLHQANLNSTRYARMLLPVPPADEQRRIVSGIKSATISVARAIKHAEQELSLIREYRTRLIADIVTGQLDVREAAKSLPADDLDTQHTPDSDIDDELDADDEPEENEDA